MTEAQRMSHPVSAKTKTDIAELLERVERTTEMAQRYLKTSANKPRTNNYFEQFQAAAVDHNVRPWSAINEVNNPEATPNSSNSYLQYGI